MVQERELVIATLGGSETDSIAETDSLISQTEPVYGLLLTAPDPIPPAPLRQNGNIGISFILCGLFILFLIIALKFRNNFKYLTTIFRNIIEIRTRQNVFDDTVREASLIFLLNILWCVCAGIICACLYYSFNPGVCEWAQRYLVMLTGIALAGIYSFLMWVAYSTIGWIFSDGTHSLLWVKGFAACQALMSPALFITALIGICRPEAVFGVGIASAIVFIVGKLIFIWKGYRIFFSQFSSWVLFLCYLCSLEIVPLVLCYRSAIFLGEIL